MNKLIKILIAAIIIVLVIIVIGSWNSKEGNDHPDDSIAYADFGDGIWSDGHELVGEFEVDETTLSPNSEKFAIEVASNFIRALNIYKNGGNDLKQLGVSKEIINGKDCYMIIFEFTGEDGKMEALVYVKGTEARLKTLSNI